MHRHVLRVVVWVVVRMSLHLVMVVVRLHLVVVGVMVLHLVVATAVVVVHQALASGREEGSALANSRRQQRRLLGDECLVDVGDDSSTCDGRFDQRIQLLVTPNGQLQVAGRDSLHLQILASVAC